MPQIVAALFVATGGVYFGLPDVDPWDEKRDARLYTGPHAVVAHPPCSRWCGVELPSLEWGCIPDGESTALVSWCGNHVKSGEVRPRVSGRRARAPRRKGSEKRC